MANSTWLINGAKNVNQYELLLNDRGLAYGDGLFETMRAIGSQVPLRQFHTQRLLQGCLKLGIQLDRQRFEQDLNQVLSMLDAPQSVIKVIVSRGGATSGYAFFDDAIANVYIRFSPLIQLQNAKPVLDAQLCEMQLSRQPRLAGVKHLNRLEQVMATAEINEPSREGILLDMEGKVVEAISSNLIAVINGVLHCPDLSYSGVQGVMLSYITETAKEEGIEIKTSSMNLEEFCQATEILACNSVRGVRNILSIYNNWQSSDMRFGIQLRELLTNKLNNAFHSF